MTNSHALYPGSFDGVTFGHLDIIRRAVRHYSRVTVAVAENPGKRQPLFSVPERVEMLRECLAEMNNVSVTGFPGLTVDFAKSIGADVILRGLRAVSDFEFEFQMAMMNENLAPEITTMFMVPAPQFSFVSSSLVKEIARYGGDISHFVPANVARAIISRLAPAK
jgi:pantetheine-phosphate adenylyltransferase